MSFKCIKCGTEYEQKVNFCRNCGSSDFIENRVSLDMQETVSLDHQVSQEFQAKVNQQQIPQQNQFQQVGYPNGQAQHIMPQQPVSQQQIPQQKKKGLAWWHILLIVLGGITIISLSVIPVVSNMVKTAKAEEEASKAVEEFENKVDEFDFDNFDLDDYTFNSDEEDETTTEAEEFVAFSDTFGEIKGDYYINEWANLKIKATGEWQYSDEEDSNSDGVLRQQVFYAKNESEDGYFSMFNFNAAKYMDIDELLQLRAESYSEVFEEEGFYSETSETSAMTIAGEEYKYCTVECNDMPVYICIRKIGDIFIVMEFFGSGDEPLEYVKTFEPVQ